MAIPILKNYWAVSHALAKKPNYVLASKRYIELCNIVRYGKERGFDPEYVSAAQAEVNDRLLLTRKIPGMRI